ncbi:pentapeptide repeat-containing protein [Nocardia sp. NPDC050697]|uniref:pentapeptide repeat-containing protein n=1 Tax=Nocardia sp. NPDC050697 TaxID=3155158 RepID=UPI0033CE51EF
MVWVAVAVGAASAQVTTTAPTAPSSAPTSTGMPTTTSSTADKLPVSERTGLNQADAVLGAGALTVLAAGIAFVGVWLTRRQADRHFAATHELEQIKALRERYTTCAEQLAHDDPAVRTAGVYGLGALGSDWHARIVGTRRPSFLDRMKGRVRKAWQKVRRAWQKVRRAWQKVRRAQQDVYGLLVLERPPPEREEVQVCVELLCAYLRSSTRTSEDDRGPRRAAIAVLEQRSQQWAWLNLDYDLRDADLTAAKLSFAILPRVDLTDANLTDAYLLTADLTRANLTRANLTDADLIGTSLNYAILTRANLYGTTLSVNMKGAQLDHANLTGADLIGAKLIGADLTGATLIGADLTGADLTGADLERAKLIGADLEEAKLIGVKNAESASWPEGYPPVELDD